MKNSTQSIKFSQATIHLSVKRSTDWSHRFVRVFAVCFMGIFLLTEMSYGQSTVKLPENPLKGRYVFEQKGCANCHDGSKIGPDLINHEYYGTSLELASVMWNHLPKMLQKFRDIDQPFPKFTEMEFSDLLAYIYYLRYLGKPGDPNTGNILFEEKGCIKCHSVANKGGSFGPQLDSLEKYISPLYLAQALWNHGPQMDNKMSKIGLQRPRFEKGEIADLQAFIRSASHAAKKTRVYQSPGNPQKGKQVYQAKSCSECHAINGVGNDLGPDLGEKTWDYSVYDIAGILWNHSSEMSSTMAKNNITRPKFKGAEMADLIAYLYFLGFTDKPGDPIIGKRTFQDRGCINCHTIKPDGKVSRINRKTGLGSSVTMAQIMWNHAPVMEKKAAEKVLAWPNLSGEDMINIYAFLLKVQGDQ